MNFKKVKRVLGESLKPSYHCSFCGETISEEALVSMSLDLGDKQFQSLYSYGLCLKENLHPSIPFIAPEEIESE